MNLLQGTSDWAALVAIIIPFIAAAIVRTDWTSQTKGLVSGAVALVIGGITIALAGGFNDLTWETGITQAVAIYGAAQAVYVILQKAMKKIEAKTSPGPARRGERRTR